MKTQGRRQSKNVIDLRKGPSKESFMHELDSITAVMRPRMEVNPKAKKDLEGALTRIRRNSAVKQTRAIKIDQLLRRSNKKQDRLK